MSKLSFAVLADLHLTQLYGTSQYAAFHWGVEELNATCPDIVFFAGDITSYGDIEAIRFFEKKVKEIKVPYRVVIGNADIRTEANISEAMSLSRTEDFEHEGRKFICINTADGHIHNEDRAKISNAGDGTVIIMHHSVDKLHQDSIEFFTEWAEKHKGLVIHGHNHRDRDYMLGQTRCVGIRCMDPDKSIKKEPCFVYVTIDGEDIEIVEKCFCFSHSNVKDFRENLGISCFDIYHDIDFAILNNLKNIEIRKYTGSDEELVFLKEKVLQWRKLGGKIVSVHMPNLKWNGEGVEGLGEWNAAVRIAKEVRAEAVTVHPPRNVRIGDMSWNSNTWKYLVEYFGNRIRELPLTTKVGIENLHSKSKEGDDDDRCFGYRPEEILRFVEALNFSYGYDRVGIVLDVGHARNNGPHFKRNVLSSWYKLVGSKTTAYHIHQTIPNEGKLKNHTAITNWFGGPSLCFVSFMWAWQVSQLNHCPMFMEMKTKENCMISLDAFEEYAEKYIYKFE